MNNGYGFKRSVFYDAAEAVKNSSVTFLLGARKCGKTVCMLQLQNEFEGSVYVDARADFNTDLDSHSFIRKVIDDIANDRKALYLIDEATYLFFPDKEIMRIKNAFSAFDNHNTKIVFAGSQSKALEYWGHSAFAGNASFIRCDFLSYPEWLAFKGQKEVSAKTYQQFLTGTKEFYRDFQNVKEYLQGCLDETVSSNNKASEYIFGNDCSKINNEMLLDVLYASMIMLHNHVSYHTFQDSDSLRRDMIYNFADECLEIGDSAIRERVAALLGARYSNFKNMSAEQLVQSLQFLNNCGLITVTYITDDFGIEPYKCRNLLSDFGENATKPDVLKRLNVCMKYPMFYADIVQELLREQMPAELPNPLLASMVECHVRGLLPTDGCFEYHDAADNEIDYISTSEHKAIEISVINKKTSNTHLNLVPDGYDKILLTKDKLNCSGDVECIPYYLFVFDNSVGKELVQSSLEMPGGGAVGIVTPKRYMANSLESEIPNLE